MCKSVCRVDSNQLGKLLDRTVKNPSLFPGITASDIGRCIPRVDLERAGVVADGVVELQIPPPFVAARHPEGGIVGFHSQGVFKVSHGTLVHALSRPRLGASHAERGVVRFALNRLGVIGDFSVAVVLPRPGLGPARVGAGVVGLEPDRLVEVGEGLIILIRRQPVLPLFEQLRGCRAIYPGRL